jgi:hypothetical protein
LGSRRQAGFDVLHEHDAASFDRAYIVAQSRENRLLKRYACDLPPILRRHSEALHLVC